MNTSAIKVVLVTLAVSCQWGLVASLPTSVFAQEKHQSSQAANGHSLEIRRVWVRHDTHLEPPWWEKDTEWLGVPAMTVYSNILANGFGNKRINVDVEFRNGDGKLISWAKGSPGFCRGNDGALRPSWWDTIPRDNHEYKAFRVPVPYMTFGLNDKVSRTYLVSVRAYVDGLSSRYETKIFLPPRKEDFLLQTEVSLGKTDFKYGAQDIDLRHSRGAGNAGLSSANHESKLMIGQQFMCSTDLPKDFKLFLQVGKSTYRGARPYGEDIHLQREHYLPLMLLKNKNRESTGIGRSNFDYLVTEGRIEKVAGSSVKYVATGYLDEESLSKLGRESNAKSLILTVNATFNGKSLHRQKRMGLPPGVHRPPSQTRPVNKPTLLQASLEPEEISTLAENGLQLTAIPFTFDKDSGELNPQKIEIILKSNESVVRYIVKVSEPAQKTETGWRGRCRYVRESTKSGETESTDEVPGDWEVTESDDGRTVIVLAGFRFVLE